MRNWYSDPIYSNDLVCDFQLNEGAGLATVGLVRDRSVNKLYGTLTNTELADWTLLTLPSGLQIMTLDLDGTDEYIDLGTSAVWDVFATSNEITVEAVIESDAVGADMIFAGHVTGTGGDACFPQLMINGSGYIEWRPTQDTGETSLVAGTSALQGSPHHIIARYEETNKVADIFIDGGETEYVSETLVCTNDTLQALGANTAQIGARDNLGGAMENYFDGHILWLRVWSRRLTDQKSKQLFARANTILGI